MMASLDVLIIFIVLLFTGILSVPETTPPEDAVADDDDEIALEDYVDNELPNFSGDVSSAVLGDSTGYDVHIEVKIANRSMSNGVKEDIEAAESTPMSSISPKNRQKAKKILDLIIEKLKHKKDAKEKVDDSTDVEIEEESDKSVKPKEKHIKNSRSKTNRKSSKNVAKEEGEEEGSKGDIADSIDKKADNKENPLRLRDQELALSSKAGEDDAMSPPPAPAKMRPQNLPLSSKGKEEESALNFKPKDQEMNVQSRKKVLVKTPHTFNIPSSEKANAKGETFSFKNPSPQPMPKVSSVHSQEEPTRATSSKSPVKSGKVDSNKYIKIKVSGDEIRIKVPEFLNKTALFSRIVNIIEEDSKKSQSLKLVKPKSNNINYIKEPYHENAYHENAYHENGSKLGNKTPSHYKYLLLKKVHKDTDKPKLSENERVTSHHLPDVVENVEATPSAKIMPIHRENMNVVNEIPATKANAFREKESDNQDDIPTQKKVHYVERQQYVPQRKLENTVSPSKEENTEQNTFMQGPPAEVKEDLSERVKLHETKEDGNEKEKMHDEKNVVNENEFYEKAGGSKNEPFVPNNFASKSFQENLEPAVDMGNKPADNLNGRVVADKKVLEIVPDELHIEDVESDKENNFVPKQINARPSISRNHKLENTNGNNIIGGMKNGEEPLEVKINPGRLFNDSLFQQAGMDNFENIDAKQKLEKQETSENSYEEPNHRSKSIAKNFEKNSRPVIDVLTFPEFSRDAPLLSHSGKEKSRYFAEDNHENVNHIEGRHKSHVPEQKHHRFHNMVSEKHERSHNVGKDKMYKLSNVADEKGENIQEDKNEKVDSMVSYKGEKPEPITTEKFKPLNNPLPSILIKEILHNDVSVSKSPKKKKHAKKEEVTSDDEETPLKKKERFDEKENEDEEAGKSTAGPELRHKSGSSRTKNSKIKGGSKLDLADLASLQLQSKDNLEIGNEEEEEGTGDDDDEYEDASGDDDDATEMKTNPDTANLSIANLAIWKASEDIHALLHSLTDREHADKVLGNLRNFIRNKHSVEAKKRINIAKVAKSKKVDHVPDLNTKAIIEAQIPFLLEVKKKSSVPQTFNYDGLIDLKKKSDIPRKLNATRKSKRHSHDAARTSNGTASTSKKRLKKKRGVVEYDKYTNHTGDGIDRLYNSIATATARIPPTFADDTYGWSSDEITNVMTQLKSTDIEEDLPTGNSDNALNSEYQDLGMPAAAYTGRPAHHIGLPQGNGHDIEPMKELIGYQKELQSQAIQNKILNKKAIFSKSPTLPEFRKNKVSQVEPKYTVNARPSDIVGSQRNTLSYHRVGNNPSTPLGNYPSNSSVPLGNGDYIEGTPEYNLNKHSLWWNNSKKSEIQKKIKT